MTTPEKYTSENTQKNTIDQIWSILEKVCDPEVPVLSVVDLGIIREVKWEKEEVTIVITPTYSGCPAMDMIRMNIRIALMQENFKNIQLRTVLSPAWTTEWMSEKGKKKLQAFGIAPPLPLQQTCQPLLFGKEEAIPCPHCHSYHTRLISQFGSTACKALYRCEDCLEPFDYFKCH